MYYLLKKGLTTGFIILLMGAVAAQPLPENLFAHYTTQQGLSHNMITGIAQDSIGFMWVATASGLNRYNGSQFVQFHSSNDSASLPAEALSDLVWLDRRRLAVCGNGLHIINTETGLTRNLFIPYHDIQYQYKFNFIIRVASNAAGDVFILTRSGLYQYDKDYKMVFRYDYHPEDKVSNRHFGFGREMFWLDKKQLLIVAVDGMYTYEITEKRLKKMEANDNPLLNEYLDYPNTLFKMFQLQPGRLIVLKPGTDSLVYINIAARTKSVTHLPFILTNNDFHHRSRLESISDTMWYLTGHQSGFYKITLNEKTGSLAFHPEKYFSSYYCKSVLKDRDNNLWIATNKGLFRQDNNRSHIQQALIPATVEAAAPNVSVDDLCATEDKLFVATRGDGGLLVYDKQSLQFIRNIKFGNSVKTQGQMYGLIRADKDHLLVGTNGPLFKVNTTDYTAREIIPGNWERDSDWISGLHKDKKNNWWIIATKAYRKKAGSDSFEFIEYTQKLFNKIHMAMHIGEDQSGNIWFGGHGLVRYNTGTDAFDMLVDTFPYIKMPDKQVNALTIDKQNNLWVGIYNNGLCRYNPADKSFLHFTRDNGLPDNNIASLIVIGNKLWVAGYSGIACLDLRTHKITSFGKEDGFPDLPIVQGTGFFYDSAQHQLYIGFSNSVVRFDPDSMLIKGPVPHLFVESVTAGNQQGRFLPGPRFSADWYNNEIMLTIGSINFHNQTGQRFAYRILKNGDERWQQLGARNSFSISNLAPGPHRIQVKLFSSDNRWAEQVKDIVITITPPFWKQTWFIIILAIATLLAVYALVKWQVLEARKKEQVKTNIQELKAAHYKNKFELEQISNYLAEAQLSALQTQMNPHFIFNALNSIKRMILDNQQQKASRYLSKFAQMIRLTLNQSKEIFATLQENIEYLERYLEMEKLRFDDSFTFQIHVDTELDEQETMIPTLMIQPLVENAIWHGLMHTEGEKKLSISFFREADSIVCMIEDNGIGIRRSEQMKQERKNAHRSMGLDNLNNRIKIMNEKYETGCSLEITDLKESGKNISGTLVVLKFNIVNNKSVYESITG
jgi:ligand-binding sensor domain-containing protein